MHVVISCRRIATEATPAGALLVQILCFSPSCQAAAFLALCILLIFIAGALSVYDQMSLVSCRAEMGLAGSLGFRVRFCMEECKTSEEPPRDFCLLVTNQQVDLG